MTSANVTDYTIYRNEIEVGTHSQHHFCKDRSRELLRFHPISEHTIKAHWLNEDEEYHESSPVGLLDFLSKYQWFQMGGRISVPA